MLVKATDIDWNRYLYVIMYVNVKCDAIYCALYNLDWYKLKSTEARNLILVMIRASEPFRITAGKVIPLTMTTFCSVRLY